MKGEVVYLYAFDVANEIVTARIGEIFSNRPVPFDIRTDHTLPRDVPLYRPLAIEPPGLAIHLGKQAVQALVRVYEVGVVSIAMRTPFDVEDLRELLSFHRPVVADGRPLDQVARQLCDEVCKSIAAAIVQGTTITDPEAYTVFCLNDLGGQVDACPWLQEHRREVAELLAEAARGTLSDLQISETLRITRSYAKSDLAVIDWDAALVIDQDGYVEDVLFVLELANLQLEEYRAMDLKLDRYLDQAYSDLKQQRSVMFGKNSATLSKLRLFRIDVTKLNDEVTHIGKFFGDWYLARVYLGAGERFYLNQWRTSVENRLTQLDDLYSVVHTDINNRRMTWLEVLIVVFFAIDLLMLAFMGR